MARRKSSLSRFVSSSGFVTRFGTFIRLTKENTSEINLGAQKKAKTDAKVESLAMLGNSMDFTRHGFVRNIV